MRTFVHGLVRSIGEERCIRSGTGASELVQEPIEHRLEGSRALTSTWESRGVAGRETDGLRPAPIVHQISRVLRVQVKPKECVSEVRRRHGVAHRAVVDHFERKRIGLLVGKDGGSTWHSQAQPVVL